MASDACYTALQKHVNPGPFAIKRSSKLDLPGGGEGCTRNARPCSGMKAYATYLFKLLGQELPWVLPKGVGRLCWSTVQRDVTLAVLSLQWAKCRG
eukprot:530311-Amphidinium_carterae.1